MEYKLRKYYHKLNSSTDKNKLAVYQTKIRHYQKQIGGTDVLNLMQPRPAPNEKPIEDFANNTAIPAYGYGIFKVDTPLEPMVFERRTPYPNDVVIKILYCGVCHSDFHSIIGEWSATMPLIPGHEVCGKIVRLGSAASNFQIGDMVLVGPYINSCRICTRCKASQEQYCENGASYIYDSTDRRPGEIVATGEHTYGGFSNVIAVNEDFVFRAPRNLPIETIGPLADAGVTVYSPLRTFGVKPGHRVAVAGIGGLGHMTIKLAKAMGAYVVALTHTPWKVEDSLRIGADASVLVTDKQSLKQYQDTFDLIIDTIPKPHDFNMYLDLVAFSGTLWIVGYFDEAEIRIGNLTDQKSIKGSAIGGRREMQEMLDLCEQKNIVPDIELISLAEINGTYERLIDCSVKYRFVVDINRI